MLEVSGLMVGYGQVTAVWDVSFKVGPDEIVAIVGPNGAGKTTTLSMATGLLRPTEGTVEVLDTLARRPGTRQSRCRPPPA